MKPVIGILGGMGPMATLQFEQRILGQISAANDQEYPVVITINDGTIPDRSDYLLGRGRSPIDLLKLRLAQLELCGSTVICVPCNTAHAPAVMDELDSFARVPILHMPKLVCAELSRCCKIFGLLATDGTVRSGVYHDLARTYGLDCHVPSVLDQKLVMRVIRSIKAGNISGDVSTMLSSVAARLVDAGAEVIVLGCTELSLVRLNTDVSVVDSLDVLAQNAVQYSNIDTTKTVRSSEYEPINTAV